jgi:hypothetical protein
MSWIVLDYHGLRYSIPIDNVAYVETAIDDKGKPVKDAYTEVHLKTGDTLTGIIRDERDLK